MPKATLLPNIIDIVCSLPSVRSQFRVKFAKPPRRWFTVERLPRTPIERQRPRSNVTHPATTHATRLFLDDKTLLLQNAGILRNGSSGISRESKCSVRLESNGRAPTERLLATIGNRRERPAAFHVSMYVINQDEWYAIHRNTHATSDRCINLPSRVRGISHSSGSDFLTATAHKSGPETVAERTHLSQSARAFAQIIFFLCTIYMRAT